MDLVWSAYSAVPWVMSWCPGQIGEMWIWSKMKRKQRRRPAGMDLVSYVTESGRDIRLWIT